MATGVPFSNTPIFSKVPPFLRSAPFGELRLSRLHALLDSLGGILWLPNQHNYTLTADTAVAPSGDPVGYIGSHRQNLPENYVKNSMMAGASAGVPPMNWVFNLTVVNGVAVTINGAGTDADGTYLEIAMNGTAGGTSATVIIQPNGAASSGHQAPAAVHQLWSSSFKFKGVSGTQMVIGRIIREGSGTTYGSFTNGGNITPTNGVAETVTQLRVNIDAGTEWVGAYFQLTVAAGSGVWNNVFRVYAPQLERGKPTAFTPTYGTAITRGVNFEPAWQDTTANKPLLGVDADGKGILTYDGSNDFFRTGIQTPEAGYIAGVWTAATDGASRGMFSSSNAVAIVGARLNKSATTDRATMNRLDGVGNSAVQSITTLGSAKYVVDAHYAANTASVRVNGANEQAHTLTRIATSTNYFRIGAEGSGGDTQTNYWSGRMLAQVWIPGARPGATIEAEIRRLLAEITAVSGVV